jgi:hypothetical protein
MDAKEKAPHVACYGQVSLERRYCEDCKRFGFVLDGRIQCCDTKVGLALPKARKRMCEVPIGRKGPPAKAKRSILREQGYCCFWCDRRFGKVLWRGRKRKVLRIEWDHLVSYAYSRDNRPVNYVASCHVCNRLKSSSVFESIDECRVYIWNKWKETDYSDVRPVWGEVQPETHTSKILPPSV